MVTFKLEEEKIKILYIDESLSEIPLRQLFIGSCGNSLIRFRIQIKKKREKKKKQFILIFGLICLIYFYCTNLNLFYVIRSKVVVYAPYYFIKNEMQAIMVI